MQVAKQTATAPCPDCEELVHVGTASREGQHVTCPNCWAYLEIVSLTPLALDWDASLFEEETDDDWD